jgi:hypothetical protein
MATSLVGLKRAGFEATVRELRALPPNLRRRALLPALRAGGRVVRNVVRSRTPLLKLSTYSGASALRRGVRKVGTVQKAVAVRTSRIARRGGDVGVFVNVRPAKAGQRGAKNPNDPYYWRWIDKGWQTGGRIKPGAFFMRAGANALPQALPVIEQNLAPQVQRYQQRNIR